MWHGLSTKQFVSFALVSQSIWKRRNLHLGKKKIESSDRIVLEKYIRMRPQLNIKHMSRDNGERFVGAMTNILKDSMTPKKVKLVGCIKTSSGSQL